MKYAIIGSREFKDLNLVLTFLSENLATGRDAVITGGARGVDSIAKKWCKDNGVECLVIKPLNPGYKPSYLYRNIEIITMADVVVAFWDGKSRGTKFVIDYCTGRTKYCEIIYSDGKRVRVLKWR